MEWEDNFHHNGNKSLIVQPSSKDDLTWDTSADFYMSSANDSQETTDEEYSSVTSNSRQNITLTNAFFS